MTTPENISSDQLLIGVVDAGQRAPGRTAPETARRPSRGDRTSRPGPSVERRRHARRRTVTPLGYQPALDGLRAIAALAVLLYHGGVGWATGGFLGVDVFFVLSGFLITWLLIDEGRRTGRISITAFYGRRFRRLAPALLLTAGAVAVYAATVAPHQQLPQIRGDLLATLTYVSNWHFVADGRDYFAQFAAPSPLAHTWSLAVEEQWYLVWPAAMAGLVVVSRRLRRPTLPIVGTSLLLAASVAWTAVLAAGGADPSRLHFGTDVRAQQLLGGALLALVAHHCRGVVVPARWRRLTNAVGLAALAWMLWAIANLDDATAWLHNIGLLVVTVATAAVVLAAVQPSGIVRRTLAVAPLRAVGAVSYGLYLWHYPTYIFLSVNRTGLTGNALLAVRLLVTALLAVASYHLVERPVRDRRWRLRPTLAGGGLVAAASVVLVVAVAGRALPSAPQAIASTPTAVAVAAGGTGQPLADPATVPALTARDLAALEAREAVDRARIAALNPDPFKYQPENNPPPAPIPGDDRLRLFMTGDSVSLSMVQGFPVGADKDVLFWNRSEIGCSLFPGGRLINGRVTEGGPCPAWWADRPNWLGEFHPDVVLIYSSVWETYDVQVDGKWLAFGSPEADAYFSSHIDDLIDQMGSQGATVAVLTAQCNQRPESLSGEVHPENDGARIDHLNDLYRAAVARHPGAKLIDLHALTCPGGQYVDSVGGQPQRIDGVHYSVAGAGRAWSWLLPEILALADEQPGRATQGRDSRGASVTSR